MSHCQAPPRRSFPLAIAILMKVPYNLTIGIASLDASQDLGIVMLDFPVNLSGTATTMSAMFWRGSIDGP